MSGKVLRSSSKIGLSYLGLRKVLLLQLKGQRVGGGRHAHDAVDVLRAEETRLVVLAAELEGQGPAGGLEGMLLLGWPAHPQPVRHLEGVPAAALAAKSCQAHMRKGSSRVRSAQAPVGLPVVALLAAAVPHDRRGGLGRVEVRVHLVAERLG